MTDAEISQVLSDYKRGGLTTNEAVDKLHRLHAATLANEVNDALVHFSRMSAERRQIPLPVDVKRDNSGI